MKYLRFRGTPYKATVNEDTPVGTTIFSAIEVNKTFRPLSYFPFLLKKSMNIPLKFLSFSYNFRTILKKLTNLVSLPFRESF